jgi:hypothetical protein
VRTTSLFRRHVLVNWGVYIVVLACLLLPVITGRKATAARPWLKWRHGCQTVGPVSAGEECPESGELGGTWHWLRSPDEEKRVITSLYNRYCIRCHGVDGRGIWDIPDVPDFTNARWQASRSDGQLARLTLEGRGACMPPFRGTITLEEAWAMARYLRTFLPGTETPRPELGTPAKPASPADAPAPQKLEKVPK